MQTIDAGTNPELANQIIDAVINSPETKESGSYEPDFLASSDLVVHLLAGHLTAPGEVAMEAEIRELTGRDEELIAKTPSLAKSLQTILRQGVVSIGGSPVTESDLNTLLAGDRDWLLLHIYAATFGRDVTLTPFCPECGERKSIESDIIDIVPVRRLDDQTQREVSVQCSVGEVRLLLPTGKTQQALLTAAEKTGAELSSILLMDCVSEINGMPLLRPSKVLDLSIRDRRKLAEEIIENSPGPQLQDITVACPDCETMLEVPLSMAALFQF